MSRLGKLSFLFAAITLLCFAVTKFLINEWVPFFWVLIGLLVVFVGTGFVIDRAFFKEFFALKTTKQGANMGVLILGFLAVMIAVNIFGARHFKTWDFSLNRINTLSEQSVKLVESLQSDLKVVYLYKKNSKNYEENRKGFTELIRKYQDKSDKIKLEFYEADLRPDIAEKYDFKGEQAVFFDYEGKKNRIDRIDEQELTSALVKITRQTSKVVYMTTGHGESDTDSLDNSEGSGLLKKLLENNNYTVKNLNLATLSKMPEDMDVMFIHSPKYPFQGTEIAAIESYLKNGGSVLVSLAYPDKSGLKQLLRDFGVELGEGFVLNLLNMPGGSYAEPNTPTKTTWFSTTHAITQVFSKNDGALFIRPMPLRKSPQAPPSLQVDELLTVQSSVIFKDLAGKQQGDVGDHSVAMAVRGGPSEKSFNLIVFGDAHFLENQLLYSFIHRDVLLNSVALLAKEDNLISISPKTIGSTTVQMTSVQEAFLLWGIYLPLPMIFLLSGLFFWVRRRHA